EQHGATAAGEKYGVSPGTIRSWRSRAGGATATLEADEPQDVPGPPRWSVVSVDVPIAGMEFVGQPFGPDGVARIPAVAVQARQMPAGEGRGVQALSDAQHARVPIADAERITDGDIIAAGSIGLRVVSRRSAASDRYGQPLQLETTTRERLAKYVLLQVVPARVRQGEDRPLTKRPNVTATSPVVPAGAGF
ncbi:hypothetical protein, partial [Candidatus Nephthysia bennettiae]|nr:hypothetical protein [Candidatus Dormibacteraeota bacterium]